MHRTARVTLAPLAGATLALLVLGGAAARTDATAKYGGTLVVGITRGEPGSIDPTRSTTFGAVIAYRTFCHKLYDTDAVGKIVPQLAAAMPTISKDKLTYTIPLRRGVRFNDNTPFDAQAVAATIERFKTDVNASRASDLESVESVTAPNAYTAVFHLSQPFAPLLHTLATPAGSILSPAQTAKLGTAFSRDPVCVGPFMFDHRVAGDSLTVIKSPYYFDRGRVHLDKIVFKYLGNLASAAAALKSGDIQVLDSISPTDLAAVRKDDDVRVMKRDALGYLYVRFNIGNRNGSLPFSNIGTPWSRSPELRQAFEEAIDRAALARVLFGDAATPGCTPVSPPAGPWFDPRIKCTPYNPAHARKLVAASGYKDPVLHLTAESDADTQRVAQFIQAQEEAVGIKVEIEPDLGNIGIGHYEAFLGDWGGGNGDPDQNLFTFLATTGSRNTSGYTNPRLDRILENGRKALSETARRTLYRAAQGIVLEDRPYVYLFFWTRFAGVSKRVGGFDFFSDTQVRPAFAQLK